MMEKSLFEDISQTLWTALPEGIRQTEVALQGVFKDILTDAFSRLELVTREEFEIQKKVLARTREKVEQLEAILEHLQRDSPA